MKLFTVKYNPQEQALIAGQRLTGKKVLMEQLYRQMGQFVLQPDTARLEDASPQAEAKLRLTM